MNKIGCAVIGTGSWGRLIASAMSQSLSFEVLAIADPDSTYAQVLAEELAVPVYSSIDAVLNIDDVKAVAVATPNDLHFSHAMQVIEAGNHLLLEKPMALTVKEAETIAASALERNLVIVLDHIQRLFPPLIELKQLVERGQLGEVNSVAISRRDLLIREKSWLRQRERVGGLLYQSAVHEFDILRWIFGEVEEIYCISGRRRCVDQKIDYPDTILTQLRFASGLVGQLWNCMSDPLMGYEGVVTGTDGTAWFDLYAGVIRWRRVGELMEEKTWKPPDQWSAPAAYEKGVLPQGEVDALKGMIENFGRVISGRDTPIVTGEDGVRSVEIAQAGYLSIVDGIPVKIPLSETNRARRTYMELEIPL